MSEIHPHASLTPEGKRLASLDVLRGVAILGILPMNIIVFAAPFASYWNPHIYFEPTALNDWIHGIIHVIFDLKMMALFSLLFGAGIAIYDAKSFKGGADETARVRWLWLRRTFILLAIGFAHLWLIWEGDILVGYAVTSMALVWWLRRLPTGWLIAAIVAMFAIHFVLAAGMGWSMQFMPKPGENATPEQLAQYQQQIGFYNPSESEIERLQGIYRGGYAGLLMYRLQFSVQLLFMIPIYIFWRVGALMLLGILLMRWRVLTAERSKAFYAIMAVTGYAIGLPITLYGLYLNHQRGWDPDFLMFPGSMPNTVASIPMMLGHAGVLLWIVRAGVLKRLSKVLANVGRMAFTNYITQSIICSLIFFGYGLGQFGRLDRAEIVVVVLLIWALQIAWSNAWLAVFRFGPLEWLWRSLSYMKPQPMRLQSSP